MADTQFGIEIDGQKVTIVEVLNDTAVSIRSVSLDNLEDSISLLLAGIKDDNQQAKIRAMLSIPKTAMRRIDVTSNLTSRKEFEDAVYNKLTVSRENTTVAGVFFRPELMDGDTISPGVAVVAPLDPVNAAYGHMGRKNEVVTKTFKSPDGKTKTMKVELFTWEKLDYVAKVKAAFKVK